MNEIYQEKIDSYILEEMSDKEKQEFESELQINKELRAQYNYTKLLKEEVSFRESALEKLNEWDDVLSSSSTRKIEKKTLRIRHFIYYISGVAASVIVAFLFVVQNNNSADSVPMVIADSNIENLPNACNYPAIYEQLALNGYEEALSLIELEEKKLSKQEEQNGAYSMSAENQHKEINVSNLMIDELRYLKAFALFKLKHMDESVELLELLRDHDGSFAVKADSLYHEIIESR